MVSRVMGISSPSQHGSVVELLTPLLTIDVTAPTFPQSKLLMSLCHHYLLHTLKPELYTRIDKTRARESQLNSQEENNTEVGYYSYFTE